MPKSHHRVLARVTRRTSPKVLWQRMQVFIFSCTVAAMLIIGFFWAGIVVNVSDSMPVGLYYPIVKTHYEHGDIVAVKLQGELAQEAIARGYVPVGRVTHQIAPMLKQLMAVPGDCVYRTSQHIRVNHTAYFAPLSVIDHNGKWVRTFFNEPGGITKRYWLYGNEDVIHSWDSRYFGGVSKSSLIGVYQPLLVYRAHVPTN